MSLNTDYNPDEFRDPISKKWMTQWEWKKKCGDGMLAAFLDAHNRDGMPIPEKLMAEILEVGEKYEQELRENVKPRALKQESAKVKEPAQAEALRKEEWFAKVDAKIVDNMKRSDCNRNPTGLLLILLLNRSFRGKKDKHKTWYRWHQERKLGHSSLQMIFTRSYEWIPRSTRKDGLAFMNSVREKGEGGEPEKPRGGGKVIPLFSKSVTKTSQSTKRAHGD